MDIKLIDHHMAKGSIYPFNTNHLYDYILANNGLFIRAENRAFSIVSLLKTCDVVGLVEIQESFKFKLPPVPMAISNTIFQKAKLSLPDELLLHLNYNKNTWNLTEPLQQQSPTSIKWKSADFDEFDFDIELHSHGHLIAYFSATDNKDETGLAIYAVIGQLEEMPQISVRVGIYGQHFAYIPADPVFELEEGIKDKFYDTTSYFIRSNNSAYSYPHREL
ncbi:hypothetical protein [Gloeothece verrucosa]|uniref:JAB domain-containing protein n=1 Tax=Gloeothece verrucosa (strain PCC 7822) TaxID=497965 RepID=E0UMF1_GLOV7|nr:hypothetical protein [Gloeothece verrucosa]ADN18131.1 conserved hypothetical protein [Gloeothece verrucosa PCC 7822]